MVACHGYRANWLQLIDIGEGLRQRGYSTILFNLRGHGTRSGPCTFGSRDADDLDVVLAWIRQQPALAAHRVGLLGLSMGGAIACQTAARYPAAGAVVLDSTYARLFPLVAGAIRRDYHLPAMPWAWLTWTGVQLSLRRRLSRLDPDAVAPRCRQPVFVIHGTADQTVPVEHAHALLGRWQGPTESWLESQVGHVGTYMVRPTDYCNRVADFFDRWLNP